MAASTAAAIRAWSLPPPSLRLVLFCWLAVGVAASVRTLVEPDRHTIFPILANSSRHWWNDQPLYAEYKPVDYYRYSPTFAVVNTPLGLLGNRAGGVVWIWLNLAVYAAGLWQYLRHVLPGNWTQQRASLFFLLAGLGGLRGFWNAQSNALMIGLLLLAAAALVREQWWRAALWLAVPVLVKLTPLAPALLFCALWPRRLPGRFGLLLAAGLLAPFLTRLPDVVLGHYAEWARHLLDSFGERWLGFRDGWTVWVVLRHLAGGDSGALPLRGPVDASWYYVLQLATAAGVLGWCLFLQWRGFDRARLVNLTLGLGVAWLLVFGPASEHATYVFLAPSLAWAFLERGSWRRGRALILAATVLIQLCGWGALARGLNLPLLYAALPVGTVLFAAWLIGSAASCRTTSEDESPLPPGPAKERWRRYVLQPGSAVRIDSLAPLSQREAFRTAAQPEI